MAQLRQTNLDFKCEPVVVDSFIHYEERLWRNGLHYVAGVDEAGRGPLAGPVFAAAVVFPANLSIEGVDDSKKLSETKRLKLFDLICEKAITVGIGRAEHDEIDELNILQATYLAMNRALNTLTVIPQHVLVDGNRLPKNSYDMTAIVGGDRKCLSIAAASIIAKVSRDRVMKTYHEKYPQYGFAQHKGYPSQKHIDAIKKFGYCPIHRRSFRIRQLEHAK